METVRSVHHLLEEKKTSVRHHTLLTPASPSSALSCPSMTPMTSDISTSNNRRKAFNWLKVSFGRCSGFGFSASFLAEQADDDVFKTLRNGCPKVACPVSSLGPKQPERVRRRSYQGCHHGVPTVQQFLQLQVPCVTEMVLVKVWNCEMNDVLGWKINKPTKNMRVAYKTPPVQVLSSSSFCHPSQDQSLFLAPQSV